MFSFLRDILYYINIYYIKQIKNPVPTGLSEESSVDIKIKKNVSIFGFGVGSGSRSVIHRKGSVSK